MKTDTLTALLCKDPSAVGYLQASLAVDIAEGSDLPKEIVWMPAGRHAITAGTLAGGKFVGTVVCDEAAFRAVKSTFDQSMAKGQRVFLDFDHEDKDASAWVKSFSWDPARGIIASVEWTKRGEDALRGKSYFSFSPAFLCDRETGAVHGLIFGCAAGGLVNAPAFGAAMPALIAARLSGTEQLNPVQGGISAPTTTTMNQKFIALLAARGIKHDANMTDEIALDLISKHDEAVAAKAKQDKEAAEAVQAKKAAAEALSNAETIVGEAVAAGRIPEEKRAEWVALIAKDAKQAGLIPSAPAKVEVKSLPDVKVTAGFVDVVRAMSKESDALKRGRIYRDARAFVQARQSEVLEVLAANSLGSLAGDLIVLRALDLLKLSFPVLSAITTDFSSENARQGQAIKTRIISVPTVVTLNDTTGWASSDATTTDVSVTIGQPKGVQLEYGSTELASTGRDLFGEQVEACHYALGKDLVDALYAVITAGNFANATTKATASVARADFVAMEKALASRGVEGVRTLLANADIYERLSIDPTLVNLATYQKADMITGTGLPPVAGFNVIRAINLPATGNLTAFGLRKDALVVATRLPEDYAKSAPAGASHGSQSVVINPDTGIAVQKTDFVDHKLAKAFSRIAWAYGVAKGNGSSGQRLISA